ncbi:unnamed protein product [Thlaspi arvense]|uniref:PGG domain-containing protein n=1 Tax=Thlaspi arvense TaxID=13288 RepID=A0AAU9SH93_THLAR|nr:unnamed protein product [Thlaspi arvense]
MEINIEENRQYEESTEWFVKYLDRQGDWLEKTRGNLMVAATVIAAMSFQVMVNPPGGVWQSDECSFGKKCTWKAGTSVLQHRKHGLYVRMVISSTVSFSASMTIILLVISGLRLRNRFIMGILVTFMLVAVICISAGFIFAVALVNSEDDYIIYIVLIYVAVWIVFPILIITIQLVRFIGWLICFICCCRPRRRRSPRRLPPLAPSLAH